MANPLLNLQSQTKLFTRSGGVIQPSQLHPAVKHCVTAAEKQMAKLLFLHCDILSAHYVSLF